MKKAIVAVAAASVLLAPPLAASGDAGRAQRGDDFQISFTLKSRNGEPVALKNFRFRKLDATCAGGTVVQVRGKLPFIKVNDRNRFSKTLRRPGRKVRVKGRVSDNLRRVKGRIRAQGNFGAAQNCDSGKVAWRAG